MIKFVLFGPESTGKSTLAEKLAKHFNTVWNPEFVRTYLEIKNKIPQIKNPEGSIVIESDIELIAIGQLVTEKNMINQANKYLFCDTNLVSSKIYTLHYFGYCPDWILDTTKNTANDYYYLLLNIDIPLVNDEQRDNTQKRSTMYQLFKDELVTSNLRYSEISGNFQERIEKCIEIINKS